MAESPHTLPALRGAAKALENLVPVARLVEERLVCSDLIARYYCFNGICVLAYLVRVFFLGQPVGFREGLTRTVDVGVTGVVHEPIEALELSTSVGLEHAVDSVDREQLAVDIHGGLLLWVVKQQTSRCLDEVSFFESLRCIQTVSV